MSLVYGPITILSSSGGATTSPPIVCDINQNPFNLSIQVVAVGTSCNTTIQLTLDEPYQSDRVTLNSSATWFNHQYLVSLTSSSVGNISYPVKGVRGQLSAATSLASTVITFIQAQG